MNAFTQKPDLSKFLSETKRSRLAKHGGSVRAIQQGGQPVLGMGEHNKSKTQIHQRGEK